MKESSKILLKGILIKLGEKKDKLCRFLPTEEMEELEKLPSPDNLSSEKFFHDGLIDTVHYSWYIPTLSSHKKKDISLFLKALPPLYSKNLQKILKVAPPKAELSILGKKFLQSILLSSLIEEDLLPIEFLPISPLNCLLEFSKLELISLVDHLSLYDLAQEINRIVETKVLKKIYSFLSEDKRKFLQSKLSSREPFSLPPIGLNKWDGTKGTLLRLLHTRGLYRLAQALSQQNPSLVWYLSHHLDIGRGNTLLKFYEKKIKPNVTEILISNIVDLVPIITKTKEQV